MRRILLLTGIVGHLFLFPQHLRCQNNLDEVLESVSKNNKSIIAHDQWLESKRLEFKSGIYLENPMFEYDYMKGRPASAGNQIDITAVQTFDFPTAYGKRKGVSNASIEKLEILAKGFRQDILLEAKKVYLELVYLNQFRNQLMAREKNAIQIEKAIQGKMENGAASILDLNKAKINLLSIRNDLRSAESEISTAHQKLTELNGGTVIVVADSVYPVMEKLSPLDSIISEAAQGDFVLQSIQQDQQISKRQEQLNKALALPKLEGGYRHQSILGQNFNGFHAGITVPLFENKNTVQTMKQQSLYYSFLEESHKNEHHNELESLYNKTLSLQEGMQEYRQLLEELNSENLLNKALQLGEISAIEYFTELNDYYQVKNDYLELEKDYHMIKAGLFKYKLLF